MTQPPPRPAPQPITDRQTRRRRRQVRQTIIFSTLIGALVLAGSAAGAVYLGAIESPFDVEFTRKEEPTAQPVVPPCPAPGAMPVTYSDINIRVLNSTSTPGLAAQASEDFKSRGFVVEEIGNASTPIIGTVELRFGPAAVNAAYTLAAQINGAALRIDERAENLVDVLLGTNYAGLIDPSDVLLDPDVPLTPRAGCEPVATSHSDLPDDTEVAPDPEDVDPEDPDNDPDNDSNDSDDEEESAE